MNYSITTEPVHGHNYAGVSHDGRDKPEPGTGVGALLIRRQLAYRLCQGLAAPFAANPERGTSFELEQQEPNFAEASKRFGQLIWKAVTDRAPDALLEVLNARLAGSDDPVLQYDITRENLDHLLKRGIFLLGLDGEKAHSGQWLMDHLGLLDTAKRLGDKWLPDAAMALRAKRRVKDEEGGRLTWNILRTWIAGGCWMLKDKERHKRMNDLLLLETKVSEAGYRRSLYRLRKKYGVELLVR